jgi:hypothetical protein
LSVLSLEVPGVALGQIAGEVNHGSRAWVAVNLDDRPGLPTRDGDCRELFCGRSGGIGAKHDIAVGDVNHKFKGHAGKIAGMCDFYESRPADVVPAEKWRFRLTEM